MSILESAYRAAKKEKEEKNKKRVETEKKTTTSEAKQTEAKPKTSILESAYRAVGKEAPTRITNRTTPTRSSPATVQNDFVPSTKIAIGSNLSDEERTARINEINSELRRLSESNVGWLRGGVTSEVEKNNAKITELEAELKELEQYFDGRYSIDSPYIGEIRSREDFGENSAYKSTEGQYSNLWDKMRGGTYGLGYGDVTYEYINNVEGVRDEVESLARTFAADSANPFETGDSTMKDKGYDKMYPEEVAVYNYIYATEGKQKAQEFLDENQMLFQKRTYDELTKKWESSTDSTAGAIVGSALSIPANIIGAFPTLIETAKDAVLGKEYNPYSPYKIGTNFATDTRKYVGEDIAKATEGVEIFGQNIPSFLYSTGMSIGDSLVGGFTLGKGAAVVMGTSAFHQKAKEMVEAGETSEKVYSTALAAGVAELLFERVSLDRLLKIKDVKTLGDVVTSALKQSGVEASEEIFTEISNILTDTFIRGDTSEIMQLYNELISKGYSEKEAQTEIAKTIGSKIGWAAAGGALSGGVSGTAISSLSYATQNARNQNGQNNIADYVAEEMALAAPGFAEQAEQAKGDTTPPLNESVQKTPLEAADEAPATLEEAAMSIVNSRTHAEQLDALTSNEEEITAEEAMAESRFGERGAELLAELSNQSGMTYSKAKATIENAYREGFTNPEADTNAFTSVWEKNAVAVGKIDRLTQDAARNGAAKSATVYEDGVIESEHFKKLSPEAQQMVRTVSKKLGLRAEFVDKLLAAKVDGENIYANAQYEYGVFKRAADSDNPIHEDTIHEALHRMMQVSPTETGILVNALVGHAEQYGRAGRLGVSGISQFDKIKSEHDAADISLDTLDIMEEIAAREIQTIFASPQEFNQWIESLEANSQTKTGWQKIVEFILKVIEDAKHFLSQIGMTAEEKANAQRKIEYLENIKKLYGDALKASEKAVNEIRQGKQNTEAKNETNTDTNGREGAARAYIRQGETKEVDYFATRDKLTNKFTKKLTAEYEAWLKELSTGIIEKKGIRNDKDMFTPSGNRRSFEALHWDYTLENIVRSMNSEQSKGAALWGGNVFGASTKEYASISDIKEDSSRLQQMTDEEYDKLKDEYKDRLDDIAHAYANGKDFYDAKNTLIEAIATKKTKQGIRSYLAQYDYVYKTTDDIVNDLWELRNDISEMPVSYFEAKPQRAVGFDEVVAAVIPKSKDKELKTELENKGVKVLEYDKTKDGDRLKKINSVPDIRFSLKKGNTTTSKDVNELLGTIEYLKHEFEITKFAKADPKKLAAMTKKLLKYYDSYAEYDEVYGAIDGLYQYMANGEDGHPAVWEEVYDQAYDLASEIVERAVVTDDSLYQEYKSLRLYLRDTRMKFNPLVNEVPSDYENFNEFRKKNIGRLKFTKDGVPIDTVYQELSGMYPEFFNAEEQTDSAAQLGRMVEVLDDIKPQYVSPYAEDVKAATALIANDIIDRFFDVPQAKPTFADKAERRVVEARIAGAKKLEKLREQKDAKAREAITKQKVKSKEQLANLRAEKNAKAKEAIAKQRAKAKEQLAKLRAEKDAKIKAEKKKREESLAKMSEKQKAKVLRARIIRHVSELNRKLLRPTDNQHIPQNLQGAVAKLLESINLESNYTYDLESGTYHKNDNGLPTKRTAAFQELKRIYEEMESDLTVDPNLMGHDGLLSNVISLADKRILDMTSTELTIVWETIRGIEATIYNVNKIFASERFATILEFAEELRADNEDKKAKKELRGMFGKVQKTAALDMLTPETFFHYLGGAGDEIFRMMRDAQDKHIRIMKTVADFTHKALDGVNVNKLEEKIHTVTLGGQSVKLTTAQLMELHVLMKRKQATDHIFAGGILPDVIDAKGLFKESRAEPIRNITMSEITEALSNLTDEQKKIADKMQEFVSTVLSEYGNEASMQVYNYEKFNEDNYWTIRTNKQEIASDIGKDTAVTTVANKGFTKGTKPNANTSIRIGSIFDTFASHSTEMATYAAWLGTSEDINRIRNFVFWEDGARTGTVKGILETVHGTQGAAYLQKLLTDIAIGVQGTDNMNPLDKLTGSFKAASVGANIRVIIQQPTAILRALDMINPIYLAEGINRPLKGWGEAKKYAPIAQWKDWGHFDINTGRQMKDILFENASFLEKTKQAGMWGASKMDSLSWGLLWNAAEAETKAKHKELEVGSEEYFHTVAKRFTEIVDHTQVVDGILQRSQIMRSADSLTKMATSFMGEPTKQYNMAMAAMHDARTSNGRAKAKAVGRLGRTAISLTVAGIINACAQSIVDALRDDDKEKKYWEKWLSAFGDNSLDTMNPLGYIPFAKDILSIMQGYDVKRMDTEAITKTFNAVVNMYKAVTGTGKYTIASASAALFAEIARLYGVPVANLKRDIKSVVTTYAIETDNYLMQYRMEKAMLDINYAGNSKNYMDILFNAYNNDREAYEIIYNDMIKSGYDAEKIKSGMETRMKKSENVDKASDLSKRYMTPSDEKKYNGILAKVQGSKAWKSANAEQRKGAEADLYEFLTSTSEGMDKLRTEARAFGVDETEYTLWQLAKEMVDNGNGSIDAKEKAKAIDMLDLSNQEIAYFYNTKQADEAYAHGIDMTNYALFKAALAGMENLTADYDADGKIISGSRRMKIEKYLNSICNSYKEYLFLLGTEYDSVKDDADYIKYFGK